ncbi:MULTISPECIES: DUF4365 domain-containing protein [unclassified Sporosarcina]|uniref:DUF4365 domain-containing protein n=1 Tax=unclassified Sporosarcina TaxID=2647733 RepID=UPI00117F08CC|nr:MULTISPECIES: DUF4365 domain-containing protein [unclassified Sporosarcina]
MANRKKRVFQHIMADDSIKIIRQTFPREWIIREYTPDYGIDLKVEIFESVQGNNYEALGEFFFAQVKSVKSIETKVMQVRSRTNVAQYPLHYTGSEKVEIEVIKFSLDTDTIVTVHSMGAAIPVYLLYVVLDTQQIFYVCLTDYIEKVLIPEDPSFRDKGEKVINIPISNEITSDASTIFPLRFSAIRMKFYAMFVKFNYQRKEINYSIEGMKDMENGRKIEKLNLFFYQIQYFLNDIMDNDIWRYIHNWGALQLCFNDLHSLNEKISINIKMLANESESDSIYEHNPPLILHDITACWDRLVNLEDMYEEIVREKNLPTLFSEIMKDYDAESSV